MRFGKFSFNFFKAKSNPTLVAPIAADKDLKKNEQAASKQEDAVQPAINWNDEKAKISRYFTVHEALWLPSWRVYHEPSEEEKDNILELAVKMDKVRDFLQAPISVHVWMRPDFLNAPGHSKHGQDYNAFVKGAPRSAHKLGKAVDWSVPGVSCDLVRSKLLPKLEEFGLCMEDLPGSNWVHADCMPPRKGGRFFKP